MFTPYLFTEMADEVKKSTKSNKLSKAILSCVFILVTVTLSFGAGLGGVFVGNRLLVNSNSSQVVRESTVVEERNAVTDVYNKSANSVVSVIVKKELPNIVRRDGSLFPSYTQEGTRLRQVGAGSGFIFSTDGYIITNRHVVSDTKAEYSVVMNDGTPIDAKVIARDTYLDIAILKIDTTGKEIKGLIVGDSDRLTPGQRVVAIGYALGEFENTVSDGIISGLRRSIVATDSSGANQESLDNIIQTDASINPGNSGGPLLDYDGNVIGVNVAVAEGAENIGFAIPINEVKRIMESIIKFGEIRRPYLGVRYVPINEAVVVANDLDVNYGALVAKSEESSDPAVVPGSPADKVGIIEDDIILEVNGEKLQDGELAGKIQQFNIGDEITLKVLSKGQEKEVKVKLEQAK